MMNTYIILGQYIEGDSFVHHLDPRTKIISLLILSGVIFFIKTALGFLSFTLFLGILVILSKIKLGQIIKSLKPLAWILIFILIVHLLSSNQIWVGVQVVWRLILLILIAVLITYTTTPLALTKGLEKILSPLKVIKIPVSQIALMMTLSLRFVPIFMEEFQKIILTQKVRGLNPSQKNFFKKSKGFFTIFLPLFSNVFRRTEQVALALEVRGYDGQGERTNLYEYNFCYRDLLAFIGTISFGVLLILIKI